MRAHTTSTLRGLHKPTTTTTIPSTCTSYTQTRYRSDLIRTPTRWQRFQAATQASGPRNPLNYIDIAQFQTQRSRLLRKKILLYGAGIAICIGGQIYMVSSSWGKSNPEDAKIRPKQAYERLDAPPASGLEHVEGRPVVVKSKPGQPEIKLDEFGHELVPTGTSTIPFFPRNIRVPVTLMHPSSTPSNSTDPAATPVSSTPGEGAQSSEEEYTLLGLGIRTVSFLSIQVYVLGIYIRTSDLGTLQEAFIKHARSNPSSSSLIPSEKEALQASLLDPAQSLQIWETILKETGTRSCVRIVPTRGTDFNHLRDGWVRGITARTQELARSGAATSREYEDESFGEAMKAFQALLSGRGKAPKGSTVLLTRDESGRLGVVYDHAGVKEVLGGVEDERVARQVWLGYLGGKNVSSEGARKSVVEGVGELVARPMGTVGVGAAAI